MTKLEIIRENKKLYNAVLVETEKMIASFEWAVKTYIILEWIKGNNWLGGISDNKHQKACEKIMSLYCCEYDEILAEESKQMKEYLK